MAYTPRYLHLLQMNVLLEIHMYRGRIRVTWGTESPQGSLVGFALVKSRADPLTPRRIISLASMYVPQTIFVKSNISGGVCVRISCSTFCAELTFKLESQLIDTSISSIAAMLTVGRLDGSSFICETFPHLP